METDHKLTMVSRKITQMIKGLTERQIILKTGGRVNPAKEGNAGRNKGVQVAISLPRKKEDDNKNGH